MIRGSFDVMGLQPMHIHRYKGGAGPSESTHISMEVSTALYNMLAYRWSEHTGTSLVRYRSVGREEGEGPMCSIETFLEAPIRSLAAQETLESGSYIISNRGMEHTAMYNEEERRKRANSRNQLANLPVSQCAILRNKNCIVQHYMHELPLHSLFFNFVHVPTINCKDVQC